MNNYYVYVYLDPTKPGIYNYGNVGFPWEPFYVGKGKDSRLYDHLTELNLVSNSHKNNRIKSIFKENKKPVILRILTELTENQALKLESEFIEVIGRRITNTGPLTNIRKGGEDSSLSGKFHSLELREKWKKERSGSGNTMYGKKHSDETKKKISNSLKGRSRSKEQIEKQRLKVKGRILSEETKSKISEKRKLNWKNLEYRNNIINSLTGHKHSCETKEKIRKTAIGRRVSSKTKKKMSQTHKRRYKNKSERNKTGNSVSKTYIVVHPSGKEEKVIGLVDFCRTNNLVTSSVYEAISKNRIHKGFKIRKI